MTEAAGLGLWTDGGWSTAGVQRYDVVVKVRVEHTWVDAEVEHTWVDVEVEHSWADVEVEHI